MISLGKLRIFPALETFEIQLNRLLGPLVPTVLLARKVGSDDPYTVL